MAEKSRFFPSQLRPIQSAFVDLLNQEFDWSAGHLATILSGCVFAPSLLTFWFVNGLLDFSTAFVIGSLGGPGGLLIRLLAYLLLVPTFLVLRVGYYLIHPVHRQTVLAGACPQSDVLSLDWFSVGILATGLPLALQNLGPWVGSNLVFLLGVFILPRFTTSQRLQTGTKVLALVGGSLLFLYANYGGMAAAILPIPDPAAVLGPVATLTLASETVSLLSRATNSLLLGPLVVAVFAVAMNRLLTRPELTTIPLVRLSLPRRDPTRLVVVSAALGTAFYLSVVLVATGQYVVLP